MRTLFILAACLSLAYRTIAIPQPKEERPTPTLEGRQILGDLGKAVDGVVQGVGSGVVVGLVQGLLDQIHNALEANDRDGAIDAVKQLVPTATPTNIDGASRVIEFLGTATPSNIVEYNAHLIANGIISGSVGDLLALADGFVSGENSHSNINKDPPTSVYPKTSCDATYTVPEDKLRAAIYVPESFTFGKKLPVILFPGTGNTGYITFAGNFIPLLSETDWADPVWVNVPGFLLDDAQVNAEYAAYALNYIASITERNVSVIAWSQGNLNVQWAFKYWPSTRHVTSDHVAISADYKGTVLSNAVSILGVTNDPSVVQQQAGSEFIDTLRSNGGDSGYIPTTSIYSSFFDEIVQPQRGLEASAFLLDSRKVGVTNFEVQKVCATYPAGTFYTHEGVLYNPLAFAVAVDALTNDGPGNLSRIAVEEICSTYLAPGLGLDELLVTENAILTAGLSLLLYLPKVVDEPAIREHALGTS